MNYGVTLGVFQKGREPQIILKIGEGNLARQLDARGKFVVKPSSWDENRAFPRATSSAAIKSGR
jgi:hypothetical protein